MASITTRKVSTGRGKQVLAGVVFLAIFAVMLFAILAAFKSQQRELEVVGYATNVAVGTMISEGDIQPITILKGTFDAKKDVSWVSYDGTSQKGQLYVLWKDREDEEKGVIGKYASNSGTIDDYMTARDITASKVEPNPWYSKVVDGSEIYTLAFDSSDVYTRLVLPGSTLRMRIITEVPIEAADEYRAAIENKTGLTQGLTDTNGYVSAVLPFYVTKEDGDDSGNTIPVAEVVFENLTMIDALNAENESIFDIYYSLECMDATVREDYIRAHIDELRSRLVPKSLVLVLTAEQATEVAEFENIDRTEYKYTVVKKTVEDDLLSKFSEIATRIGTITVDPNENK